ncbi:transcription factor [uncultured Clostridium sp.]|uniref:transcription factor n=1 Tax=uncultured Clostridium sp. TaxID=59620 RepID=UPI0028E3D914|nr:transcription factor [uncultured Clostridium sp.]
MEKTLITRKDLMSRWGLSYSTICNYEFNGTLTRNSYFESPMYYMEEVIKIESLEEPNPLSPIERRRLENKIKELEEKINYYEKKINNIKIMLS